jgi:TniQ
VLQFETFDDPDSESPALRQLPLYVEPMENEVLLSWLLRLATRLGVSLQTLVRAAFWIDDRRERSQWWRRPEPQMLSRIAAKTGINIERLRGMTLESWSPVYRDDEAGERFSAERFRVEVPRRQGFRYVFCEQCLDAYATPYLRTPWAIGWVAVCPEHASIMTARCQKCRAKLRIGRPSSVTRFSPATCVQCGNDLRYGLHEPAHPSVIRLQHALLEGKRDGTTELAGVGRLSWIEVVALADVVLGMFWTDTTLGEQQRSYWLFQKEYEFSETQLVSTRYRDLAFFAWLTESWPDGTGPQIAMDMLARWLSDKPNRIFRHLGVNWSDPWNPGLHQIPQQIRGRLGQLLEAPHATLICPNPGN